MSVNIKNPAIKRIHADLRELMKDPSDQYYATPLESNLFEWHFTIRGPPDTEFEGGVYHGRIILPPEYPFRPPDIIFNTPNGRFSTGMKICLTISSYHPEYWQPAWGIRLILEALISFFPTASQGALGGLDWSAAERKRLAAESGEWKCYKCGLAKDLLPELRPEGSGGDGGGSSRSYADQIKELHRLKAKTAEEVAAESLSAPGASDAGTGDGTESGTAGATAAAAAATAGAAASGGKKSGETCAISKTAAGLETSAGGRKRGEGGTSSPELMTPATAPSSPRPPRCSGGEDPAEGGGGFSPSESAADDDDASSGTGLAARRQLGGEGRARQATAAATGSSDREDDLLSFFAVAIALAILGILIRKLCRLIA